MLGISLYRISHFTIKIYFVRISGDQEYQYKKLNNASIALIVTHFFICSNLMSPAKFTWNSNNLMRLINFNR
jgi:hypothetical protein